MLTVIKNPLNASYAGMLKKPDMSLVIGDLSSRNQYKKIQNTFLQVGDKYF